MREVLASTKEQRRPIFIPPELEGEDEVDSDVEVTGRAYIHLSICFFPSHFAASLQVMVAGIVLLSSPHPGKYFPDTHVSYGLSCLQAGDIAQSKSQKNALQRATAAVSSYHWCEEVLRIPRVYEMHVCRCTLSCACASARFWGCMLLHL